MLAYTGIDTGLCLYLPDTAPSIVRVLDVSAAIKTTQAKLALSDLGKAPFLPASRRKQMLETFSLPLGEYEIEVSLAHAFLAPSSFVRESLLFAGAREGDVHLCPYGSSFVPASAVGRAVSEPMRFVFCGRMVPNKRGSPAFSGVRDGGSERFPIDPHRGLRQR